MNKEEIVKEVITILDTSSYIDPAEHLYDGLKQIKREITYATVHDFLWALESSTVIDVNGIVSECANKIKPLLADMIIDEAYKNYLFNSDWFPISSVSGGFIGTKSGGEIMGENLFINKIKTDSEFSEKWGLKIEERELNLDERAKLHSNPEMFYDIQGTFSIGDSIENSNFPDKDWLHEQFDKGGIPTKLITLTYNNEKIESYE